MASQLSQLIGINLSLAYLQKSNDLFIGKYFFSCLFSSLKMDFNSTPLVPLLFIGNQVMTSISPFVSRIQI